MKYFKTENQIYTVINVNECNEKNTLNKAQERLT